MPLRNSIREQNSEICNKTISEKNKEHPRNITTDINSDITTTSVTIGNNNIMESTNTSVHLVLEQGGQESRKEIQIQEIKSTTSNPTNTTTKKKKKWKEPKRKKKKKTLTEKDDTEINNKIIVENDRIYIFKYKESKAIDNSTRGNSLHPKLPKNVRFLLQNINSL
jgi:hypothetical protein